MAIHPAQGVAQAQRCAESWIGPIGPACPTAAANRAPGKVPQNGSQRALQRRSATACPTPTFVNSAMLRNAEAWLCKRVAMKEKDADFGEPLSSVAKPSVKSSKYGCWLMTLPDDSCPGMQ
jgi:hypothetical protein